ncbi:riboflavin synthase [Marinivivus vitaminiproducens]|uniref:riboflavin synthase n=1 Tax=Marinivivus vitaminiproducens TaxID=3035935 RepID=UPI00279BADF5|nr:riboflavin synthase [Geminicoccaceae bacterium SCSIO 64248]
MFTGIVTDVGRLAAIDDSDGRTLTVSSGYDPSSLELGASVCHNGVCLTVTEIRPDGHVVQASGETLKVTTAGVWQVGDPINLERSLRIGDELGGHIVFGHVDGVGRIAAVEPIAESRRITIEAPVSMHGLLAVKGSVAVDGVSLTINEVSDTGFVVNVIPHTWQHTRFRSLAVGAPVNLEADMLARYVARQLAHAARSR